MVAYWLNSATEIAFVAVMGLFGKKYIMIDSVKDFLQVYEDTTGKVAIVKIISYHNCEAYKSMISWIIISKTKLIGKQYFIFSEEVS